MTQGFRLQGKVCGTFRAVQAGLHVKSNSECIIDLLIDIKAAGDNNLGMVGNEAKVQACRAFGLAELEQLHVESNSEHTHNYY